MFGISRKNTEYMDYGMKSKPLKNSQMISGNFENLVFNGKIIARQMFVVKMLNLKEFFRLKRARF